MISKAVGSGIFTTMEKSPYDILACALLEVSKSWEWIWFSFLEWIKLEANKKIHFFSSVSQQSEQMLRYQNRRGSTSCTGSANRSSLPFSSRVPCDRADLPADCAHLSMKWMLLPVLIRAVSEFFQTFSLTGCFALFSGCGEELSGPSGSFHSPGYPSSYPSNRECIWYIHTAPGSSIQLTIHEFDIEYHPNCRYDVLEVRSLVLLL